MKGGWNHQQHLAQKIKGTPENHETQKQLKNFDQTMQIGCFSRRRCTEFCQTTGTNDSIFMFAHAFPAKKSRTFRTPRCGFT
jgi:hypothetical protein